MNIEWITRILAFIAFAISLGLFASRWQKMQALPYLNNDKSDPKDSPLEGILYAFTLGMAPWAKESTRIHMLAYLRGIVFHIGIFAGLAALIASPWLDFVPAFVRIFFAIITGIGALMGIVGGVMRIVEHNLRGISSPDDHASVWLVSIWLAATTLTLITTVFLPAMYIVATVMMVYAPLGKIRHCLYFYCSRFFYGLHIGRRGVVSGLIEHSFPIRLTGSAAASYPLKKEASHVR